MLLPRRYFKFHNTAKTSLFFVVSFCLSMTLLLPITPGHYKQLTLDSTKLLERKLDSIKSEFENVLITSHFDKHCESFVRELRQSVFNAHLVKEAAVFNQNDQFYCSTTEGDVSFRLFKSIRERLNNSPTLTTLSYSSSAITKAKAIMLIFSNQYDEGVSLMIPPKYIYDIVHSELAEHGLESKVEIIDRDISPANHGEYSRTIQVASDRYPLTVTSYIGIDYYLSFFLSYSWFGFLLAGVTTICAVSIKHKKQSQRSLEYSLSNALRRKHLHVHFQPIVDQRTQTIVGCESLLRWKDPVEGNVSPAIFIPLAESLDLIEDLTYFVLSEVMMLISENQPQFKHRYISVNISRNVVSKAGFADNVFILFKKHPELLKKVMFEITEDGECSDKEMEIIKANLKQLSALGVKVAIDDFGTGYAGLDFVRQFPFSTLKIDRVFVKNIGRESDFGIPLLESMLQLSHTLNMQVIVEGVENESQLEALSKLGVIYIQGFYFYKPASMHTTLRLLQEQDALQGKVKPPSVPMKTNA